MVCDTVGGRVRSGRRCVSGNGLSCLCVSWAELQAIAIAELLGSRECVAAPTLTNARYRALENRPAHLRPGGSPMQLLAD